MSFHFRSRKPLFLLILTFLAAASSVTAGPIVPISAVSRKNHGGLFDVPLPLTGAPGIECREDTGEYYLAIEFATPVTVTTLAVTTGVGYAGNWWVDGSTVHVFLGGVADGQRLTVTLGMVRDGSGSVHDVIVPMNVLAGDVTANGKVDVKDIQEVENQIGRPVTVDNFRTDVTIDKTIDENDVGFVDQRLGANSVSLAFPQPDFLTSGESSASVLLKSDGTVSSWGTIPGDGTSRARSYPSPLPGLTNIISVSAGVAHAAALAANSVVWVWGENSDGQVGDDTNTTRRSPIPVMGSAISVKAGGYHTVALLPDGTVATWGQNSYGQLGFGNTTNSSRPEVINGLTGITQIAAGFQRSLALGPGGTVWTWGYQSEDPENPGVVFYTEPTQVDGLIYMIAIAAGSGHAVAVMKGGSVFTWGNNSNGELGDGTTTYSGVPVENRDLSNVVAVSAGHNHTLALLADGTVRAWGSNEFGQLGVGTDGDFSTVPVQVGSLTNIVAVVAASSYSMALRSDGTIWAWGAPNPALGLASTTNITSPQQVFFGLLDQNANFMDDRWELQYFGNLDQTGEGDYDGDGISNLAEFQSSHTNPVAGDSDGDFVLDGEEIEQGSDPNDNTSYPPRLRDASRYLRMTSYLVYAHIEYWLEAPWSTLLGGEEDISPHPFLRELGPILGARVALPNDVGRSYGSSMISATSYLDNVAWIQHRRLWLHRFPATGVEARQKVIVNRHHDINGKVDPPLARIETLTIPPGQTTSNPIDSSTDLEQAQVVPYLAVPEGVVESIWPLDTYAVSFGGDNDEYYELQDDNGAILHSAPQWVDVDHDPDSTNAALGERNNAVAFKRNTKPQIGAVFLLQGFPVNYPIKIRAHGSDGIEIPATNPVRQNDYFEVPATTESTTAFPDTIKYYNKNDSTAFTLTWQISLDNEQTWLELGTTKHTVYLTWDYPVTSLRQESLFHLGCRQANGIGGQVGIAATREQITEAIWTDFHNRAVHRMDGTQLKYYGSYLVPFSPVHETEQLLATGDGQCSAWAKLFLDIRKVQGLEDDLSYILLRPFSPGLDKGFIIANWSFAASGHSGHPDYPYLNLPDSPPTTQVSYRWRGTPEVNDEPGIAGQGTLDPASLFMNHRVVFLHNRYYDPSYGVTYSDLSSIETSVIVGFSLVDPQYPVDEPTVHLDLNGNGNMTDLGVPTPVYLFRTNGPALEIFETPSTYQ